jgi:hypothetical protein
MVPPCGENNLRHDLVDVESILLNNTGILNDTTRPPVHFRLLEVANASIPVLLGPDMSQSVIHLPVSGALLYCLSCTWFVLPSGFLEELDLFCDERGRVVESIIAREFVSKLLKE